VKIAVFLSYGVGVEDWERTGLKSRREKIYEGYLRKVLEIFLITYDKEKREFLGGEKVKVLFNFKKLHPLWYSILSPYLHRTYLKEANAFTTTQMNGVWTALIAKFFLRKPLVVRYGFSLSQFKRNRGLLKYWLAKLLEIVAYKLSDKIIVTTPYYKETVSRYVPSSKVVIVPNGVDTNLFKPLNLKKEPQSLIFVGRLNKQKNLKTLIQALAGTDYKLYVVGTGELKQELEELAERLKVQTKFLGTIPNDQLPLVLNRCEIFVFPSLYEGHPKALIEAMACGLPVIASNVEGNREIIENGENGLLCEPTTSGIKNCLKRLEEEEGLKILLGSNARKKVESNFSLNKQLEGELKVIFSVV
jgi:glycosyltransferase involved in cell wall biosynthesis